AWTRKAINEVKKLFGEDIDCYFVMSGTGANVLGLKAITNAYHSILCAETAHINVDECGAPENYTGCKIVTLKTINGKIHPEEIEKKLYVLGTEHHSQPKVISISQCTELGTVYTPKEIRNLADFAHEHNLYLHMDGARLANAAVFLNKSLKEITADAGVDVLSFGGTKNGMMLGEAVIFFNRELSADFKYIRKQGMQLYSKMRFISAQFSAILENDLFIENAIHANKMAQILYGKIKNVRGLRITQKVETNAIFAIIPHEAIEPLQKKRFFYVWNDEHAEVRWMTSFDTTEEDIEEFVADIKSVLENF
ncbi:MAG: low specificity L-threonine aldolase, partial [Candidatus Cloacimonetes bacterium]|nr:low specificity L-threonine aldolase [Candidatus Cloacimonadota bacterium]